MTTTRTHFDYQLTKLQNDVIQLGEIVEQAIAGSVTALGEHDLTLAKQIDTDDATINKLRLDIEEQAYALVALQQPNSADMRLLMASTSIATNLERMADHAAGIARLTERIGANASAPMPDIFQEMATSTQQMLRDLITAFKTRDEKLARLVITVDDQIDALDRKIYDQLLQQMIANPANIEHCTFLLWVSHNMERIADRVTNVCERVIYLLTGELTEHIDTTP